MRKYFLWLIVFGIVFINYSLKGDYFRKVIPYIDNIQYGNYLIQKWFLVIVGFLILLGWVIKNEGFWRKFRKLLPYFLIIALITFLAHWFSFYRWFDFDDYRLIGHHNFVVGTDNQNQMGMSSTHYGIALPYLVVRWFGTNFEAYNALGLFVYSLSGIIIFLIANKIQKNKAISLITALFFVTSPTYYRQTLMMQEVLADGFSFFLFSLAVWTLISGYYKSSIILTASALEFGFARTHFIAIPLILTGLLFSPKETKEQKLGLSFNIILFPVLTLLYLPLMRSHPPDVIDYTNLLNNWKQVVRFTDTFFGVTVPHGFVYPLIIFIKRLTAYPYISPLLGSLLILALGIFSIWLFIKRKVLAAKLIGVGLISVVAGSVMPTLSGIRLVHDLKALTMQYIDVFPAAPTSYGVMSAFGLVLIVLGFSQIISFANFKKILIIIIIIDVLTLMKADTEWTKQYSFPVRASNPQLGEIIPADGKVKVIYTAPPGSVLSRYVSFFYQLYRIKEPLYIQNDPGEFIKLLDKYKPDPTGVFLLTQDNTTYKIHNYSDLVRSVYPRKITPEYLESLELKIGKP